MSLTTISGTAGAELMDELAKEYSGERKGIEWPSLHLNRMFGTIRPGELTIVSGTEGSGKSYLLFSLLMACERLGISWYYLPMEETPKYWLRRFVAILEDDYSINDIDGPELTALKIKAYERHFDVINSIQGKIFDNPRTPIEGYDGESFMRDVPWQAMADDIVDAAKFADIVVVDPVTMVDFELDGYDENDKKITSNEFSGQRDFVRRIVAGISKTKCHLMVATHSTKDGQNIQGHADWTRFSQNSIKMVCHDEIESEVMRFSDQDKEFIDTTTVNHTRTIHIHKTRNGKGSRRSIACDLGIRGPQIKEYGVIVKSDKGRR